MPAEHSTPPGPPRNDVPEMFDRISCTYDRANAVLSLGCDRAWRRRLAEMVPPGAARVLDLATGTCDVLLTLARRRGTRLAVGADLSAGMLRRGCCKVAVARHADRCGLVRADATRLGFADGAFDAVTMAFGIRNVTDTLGALREIRRVLRPGGRALILEFSLPKNVLLRAGYLLYFRHILPRVGGLVSGEAGAYRYLNRTVETFPYGGAFCALLAEAGFSAPRAVPLTFGIAAIYEAVRPENG